MTHLQLCGRGQEGAAGVGGHREELNPGDLHQGATEPVEGGERPGEGMCCRLANFH